MRPPTGLQRVHDVQFIVQIMQIIDSVTYISQNRKRSMQCSRGFDQFMYQRCMIWINFMQYYQCIINVNLKTVKPLINVLF